MQIVGKMVHYITMNVFLWVRDDKQSAPGKRSFKSLLVTITETEPDRTAASSNTELTEVHKIISSTVCFKNTSDSCFVF